MFIWSPIDSRGYGPEPAGAPGRGASVLPPLVLACHGLGLPVCFLPRPRGNCPGLQCEVHSPLLCRKDPDTRVPSNVIIRALSQQFTVVSGSVLSPWCGGGGAPRDSAGSGATEEGLTSRQGASRVAPGKSGLHECSRGSVSLPSSHGRVFEVKASI